MTSGRHSDHRKPLDPGRRARLHRLRRHGLSFRHSRRELVDAVDAAREGVLDATDETEPAAGAEAAGGFERAALAAYAALVIGEREQARSAIHALRADRADIVSAWLTARHYAWTGEPDTIQAVQDALTALQRIRADANDDPGRGRSGKTDPLLPVVARDLIATAEATAHPELVSAARRLAGGADPTIRVDAMLGLLDTQGLTPDPAAILNGLIRGATDEPVRGWEEIATDNTRTEWTLPLLVAGILGLDPDAERGRLRAMLRVPAAWPAWGADNIRVGDASAEMDIRRDGPEITVAADQATGALPLTLILEATVHAPVVACFVDEQPAELALRPFPDRVVVPVQLVLDAPRELRIRLAPAP